MHGKGGKDKAIKERNIYSLRVSHELSLFFSIVAVTTLIFHAFAIESISSFLFIIIFDNNVNFLDLWGLFYRSPLGSELKRSRACLSSRSPRRVSERLFSTLEERTLQSVEREDRARASSAH